MIRYSKRIEKIIRESAFDKKKGIPGIKFNPGFGRESLYHPGELPYKLWRECSTEN